MEFTSNQKVPFWPSDSVIDWGKNLPCMIRDKIYLKEWPDAAPDQDSVFIELERLRLGKLKAPIAVCKVQ